MAVVPSLSYERSYYLRTCLASKSESRLEGTALTAGSSPGASAELIAEI